MSSTAAMVHIRYNFMRMMKKGRIVGLLEMEIRLRKPIRYIPMLPQIHINVVHTHTKDGQTTTQNESITLNACISIGTDGVTTTFNDWIIPGGLPAGSSIGLTFCVYGTIELDQAVTQQYSFQNCELNFAPEAKIVVEPNTILSFYGNPPGENFLHGCGAMWQGIEVESGGHLNFLYNRIEDAEYAIKLNNNAEISILNNTFDRNFIGVYMPPSIDQLPQNYIGFRTFESNIFDCTAPLSTPYTGQQSDPALPQQQDITFAGVLLNDISGNYIGPYAPEESLANIFRNISNGIVLNRCNFLVRYNIFQNIQPNALYDDQNPTVILTGRGVLADCRFANNPDYDYQLIETGFGGDEINDPVSFDNCWYGIDVRKSSATARRNIMLDMTNGIQARECQNRNLLFEFNHIECSSSGIYMWMNDPAEDVHIQHNDIIVDDALTGMHSPPSPGGVGIYFFENLMPYRCMVWDNDVDISTFNIGIHVAATNLTHVIDNRIRVDPGANDAIGINLDNGFSQEVRCNTITDWSIAEEDPLIDAAGMRLFQNQRTNVYMNTITNSPDGMRISGMCNSSNIECNIFDGESNIGLNYSQFDAETGVQEYRRNEWNGTFTPWAAQFTFFGPPDSDLLLASAYIIETTDAPYWPSPIDPISDWFFYVDAPILPCLEGPCTPDFLVNVQNEVNLIDTFTANGRLDTLVQFPHSAYINSRQLYEKLLADSTLMPSGSVFDTFFTSTHTSGIADYYNVRKELDAIYEIPSTLQALRDSNRVYIEEELKSIIEIDSLIAIPGADTSALTVQKNEAMDNLDSLNHVSRDIADSAFAIRSQQISLTRTANLALSGNAVYENNEKEVNDIYLNTIALGNSAFDSIQIAQLQSIAEQCPLSGGSAVIVARNLLAAVETTVYNDDSLCQTALPNQGMQVSTESSAHEVLIFPNPADQSIRIVFAEAPVAKGSIKCIGIDGVVKMKVPVQKGQVYYQIDTSTLPSGIYFVHTIVGDKEHVSKLVISR